LATEARIDNRKKLVKHQYLLHMSSQYGELMVHLQLRSVRLFGAPKPISMGFASWQRYCTTLQRWAAHILVVQCFLPTRPVETDAWYTLPVLMGHRHYPYSRVVKRCLCTGSVTVGVQNNTSVHGPRTPVYTDRKRCQSAGF